MTSRCPTECGSAEEITTTPEGRTKKSVTGSHRGSEQPRTAVFGKLRIPLRNAEETEAIRRAGRVVANVLDVARQACSPGMTTAELSDICLAEIRRHGAESLFRGYRRGKLPPFPGDVCISVNEQVVHGIPGERIIREGDLVKVDCGVRLNGWCGDGARSILVGRTDEKLRKLVDATRNVLALAVDMMQPGTPWSDIALAMETAAAATGFGIVLDYVGHGVGRELHEPPKVPAFATGWDWKFDFVLRPGMVLAVEPMLTAGSPRVESLPDGWTVATCDGGFAAHEEHTIALTERGASILTRM